MTVVTASAASIPESSYQQGWRRMILDHEIPAFDERFLSEYDPAALADRYAATGLTSYMFFCKQMNGWCFWPTTVGEMHPGLRGRDIVGETAEELRKRRIAPCAYYCAVYDNWAFHRHPDWRIQQVGGWRRLGWTVDRWATCCPNAPGYRQYISEQIADLFGRYQFECGFVDMTFWPLVCGCHHCVERYRDEEAAEIPETIDWTSPEWCSFQAARERWIGEFQGMVTDRIREASPGIAVYHNFAAGPVHWMQGLPFSVTEHSDFLGGDLYGDDVEQLLVNRLMRNLTRSHPAEYMTSTTADLMDHVGLKRPGVLRAQALEAVAESTAFTLIDAIDPVGVVNHAHYEIVKDAFDAIAPFEPYTGGDAIEDVGVYFSDSSRIDFAENGRPLSDPVQFFAPYPHMQSVRGACRILDRAHIPFGVVTRRQLESLGDYRVLVLPNVVRLDAAEAEAIREYVRGGGRLYASRYTSLVETRGVHHDDFMLADVFGVHMAGEEGAAAVYVKPETDAARSWLGAQRYVSADPARSALDGGLLRLRAHEGAETLASLSLPFGHPEVGDMFHENWSSLCSYPPWDDTGEPAIVSSSFGSGRAVYSSFDVEAEDTAASDGLFAGIVADLLGDDWTVRCEAHPSVSLTAFHLPGDSAFRVSLANTSQVVTADTTLRLRAPGGKRFVALEQVPAGRSVEFSTDADGTIECVLGQLAELTMLIARYE